MTLACQLVIVNVLQLSHLHLHNPADMVCLIYCTHPAPFWVQKVN